MTKRVLHRNETTALVPSVSNTKCFVYGFKTVYLNRGTLVPQGGLI